MGQKLVYKMMKDARVDHYQNIGLNTIIDGYYNVTEAQIISDTAFSFINKTPGETITLVLTNLDSIEHQIVFAGAGGRIDELDEKLQPGLTTSYNILCLSDGVIATKKSANGVRPIFTGSLGNLHIPNGATHVIEAGQIYDYADVLIEAGGLLEISNSANTMKPTELYFKNLTLDGIILGKSLDIGYTASGVFLTHGKGASLNFSFQRGNGGAGGRGGWYSNESGSAGGAFEHVGGGGSGGAAHGAGSGYGGTGNSNGQNSSGTGGVGGTGHAANGSGSDGGAGGGGGGGGGSVTYHSNNGYRHGGGGGGGGAFALSGLPLYICAQNGILGSGLIDVSGNPGEKGGNGYKGYGVSGDGTPAGGGGGGGGAGGAAGGHIFLDAPGLAATISYNVSGGAGGPGGSGGAGNGASGGASGANGTAGIDGTFQIL